MAVEDAGEVLAGDTKGGCDAGDGMQVRNRAGLWEPLA